MGWELHLLATAFKKDVNDPDREAIPMQHVLYYYNKYFKKALHCKTFGKDTIKDLSEFVKDAVKMEEPGTLASILSEEAGADMMCKLTEEKRRERQRRIDAGDEMARL